MTCVRFYNAHCHMKGYISYKYGTLGSPLIDGIFLVQKNVYLFLRYSVYNFIDYSRSSSMRGQLVMHQCLHRVYIFS